MLNRTIAPPFQKSTTLTLLTPQTYKTTHGSVLHVLSGGTQEVLRLELIAPAGKWYEPFVGISHFTASQLDKGTKAKNSFQIASLFDAYGAHVEISPGNDFITITIYALVKNVEAVLEVVLELLNEPVFPQHELDLAKNIAFQNLKVNEEKTSYLAGKYFRKAIFGEHPYGSEFDAGAIQKIQVDDLKQYHLNRLGSYQAIASGNVSEHTAKLLLRLLEQLKATAQPHLAVPVEDATPSNLYLPKDGSVQTTIRYGKKIVNRKHKDFFDVLFATHLLGGYFGSRLMKNIREEKGLTYGIYASVQPLLRDAFFVIGADVNRENKDLTLDEIKNELNKLRTEAVEQSELDTARNHFIGSLQAEVTTAFAHGDKFKTVLLNNLDFDYYQQMINRVNAIKAEDLQRIANQYFDVTTFTEVAVG